MTGVSSEVLARSWQGQIQDVTACIPSFRSFQRQHGFLAEVMRVVKQLGWLEDLGATAVDIEGSCKGYGVPKKRTSVGLLAAL